MSENDDKNLIGYDPLAWLDNEEQQVQSKSRQVMSEKVDSKTPGSSEQNMIEPVSEKVNVESAAEPLAEKKVSLPAKLNIQSAQALYDQLKEILDTNPVIEIDASDVGVIDTSSLQILMVLKQTAEKMDKQIQIDFPSEAFIEAAELLGLSDKLGVDSAASGFF